MVTAICAVITVAQSYRTVKAAQDTLAESRRERVARNLTGLARTLRELQFASATHDVPNVRIHQTEIRNLLVGLSAIELPLVRSLAKCDPVSITKEAVNEASAEVVDASQKSL